MEDSGMQDRKEWKLKWLWYQDSTMMNYYFSWLPEELFDEIIDILFIPKKKEASLMIQDSQNLEIEIRYPIESISPLFYST
jgi:hypothetical protein